MNPLRKVLGVLKLLRADRETLARVESPKLVIRPHTPYSVTHQLNVYDGHKPTFKAPPL